MSTFLSAEDQLRESGCTDEDIEIMKALFGDEHFQEVRSLEDNKDDAYGKVVSKKENGAVSYKEHDPNVDTLYVDLEEVQYFGDLPHYCNFVRSQVKQAIKKQRALVIRMNKSTADALTRADPTIFEDATIDYL